MQSIPPSQTPCRKQLSPPRFVRPHGERQRSLLLALVAANPGIHVRRTASLLGINWNTSYHHVRRLEASGLISVRRVGGAICLFDRRQGVAASRLGVHLLRDGRNGSLVDAIASSPGVNQRALGRQLGLAASVVHRRLVQLEEAGLVRRVPRGRETLVIPSETLAEARAKAAPSIAPAPEGSLLAATAVPSGPEGAWHAVPAELVALAPAVRAVHSLGPAEEAATADEAQGAVA